MVSGHVRGAEGWWDHSDIPNQHPSLVPYLGQQVIHALTVLFMVPAQNPKQTKYLDLRLG